MGSLRLSRISGEYEEKIDEIDREEEYDEVGDFEGCLDEDIVENVNDKAGVDEVRNDEKGVDEGVDEGGENGVDEEEIGERGVNRREDDEEEVGHPGDDTEECLAGDLRT